MSLGASVQFRKKVNKRSADCRPLLHAALRLRSGCAGKSCARPRCFSWGLEAKSCGFNPLQSVLAFLRDTRDEKLRQASQFRTTPSSVGDQREPGSGYWEHTSCVQVLCFQHSPPNSRQSTGESLIPCRWACQGHWSAILTLFLPDIPMSEGRSLSKRGRARHFVRTSATLSLPAIHSTLMTPFTCNSRKNRYLM